jgi:hypothetical protein
MRAERRAVSYGLWARSLQTAVSRRGCKFECAETRTWRAARLSSVGYLAEAMGLELETGYNGSRNGFADLEL